MSRPIIKTHNVETNEVTEKEMSLAEFNQLKTEAAAAQAEVDAKATARQAILDRLGLTAEEAQLLLGGN
jgi:hypothetical protein